MCLCTQRSIILPSMFSKEMGLIIGFIRIIILKIGHPFAFSMGQGIF